MAQNHRRVFIQHLNAPQQKIRSMNVVVCGPLKVFPGSKPERPIEISCRSNILGISVVADTRVTTPIASTDRLGSVRRGVVANDDLEVVEGLVEKRFDLFRNVPLAIIDR